MTGGIGWHRHPAGWWVFGIAAGEGCELCDAAEAWLVEELRAVPLAQPAPVEPIDAERRGRGALAAALAARKAAQKTLF